MGQLLVRGLSDDVIRAIKARAAAHGRSAEAEHRAILEAAVRLPAFPPAQLARALLDELRLGGPDGSELLRAERDRRAGR